MNIAEYSVRSNILQQHPKLTVSLYRLLVSQFDAVVITLQHAVIFM